MSKKDIERFVKDLRTTVLRDFSAPSASESSLLYSDKSSQFNVDRTTIPVPELIQFVSVVILKLSIYGPGEKLRWEIPFYYKNFSCAFALKKFGLRLYIRHDTAEQSDLNKISNEIINKIQKAILRVEKTLLTPFADQQIKNGHVTIANHYHTFKNRYFYFREKAEKISKQEKRASHLKSRDMKAIVKSMNDSFRRKNELFYNTIAMLDAYFSYLEHFFILSKPLIQGNAQLVEFISLFWSDKYKRLFDIQSNSTAKSFYDKLNAIKERFRNFFAHGGFEKGGASLYIHIPKIGAIPAQFSKVKSSPHFDFFPIQENSLSDMCKEIDDFEKWLRSDESVLRQAIKYVESGLDIPCDKKSLSKIQVAMKSDDTLESLVEYYNHLWEMHTNMDY